MNISGNAVSNMDVTGVNQASSAPRPEPVQPDTAKSLKDVTAAKEQDGSAISRQEVQEMVDALEDLTHTLQTKLNFSINEGTNDVVVKVLEKDTEKVIKQFPPEELLELQEKMQDLTGLLFSADA